GEVVPRRVLVGGGGDAGGCLAAGAVAAAAQRARLPQVGAGRWQGGGEQVGAVDPGHAFGVPCADAEGGPGGGPAGGADERGHRCSSRVWWQVPAGGQAGNAGRDQGGVVVIGSTRRWRPAAPTGPRRAAVRVAGRASAPA